MIVFLLAPLAAYGGLWGVKTAATGLIGAEVASGRMAKKEARVAFELDLNPLRSKGKKEELITFELPAGALPPELSKFERRYIMTKEEQHRLIAALDALMCGEDPCYDFDWTLEVQDHRLKEPALQN